jgi:rhodanese-related sulfurtransferase
MKTTKKYLLPILLFSLIASLGFFSACNNDDDPEPIQINEAEVLVEYLESAASPLGKDFVSTDLPTIISATDVNSMNLLGTVYIIDIRSAGDWADGHIANAVNVAAGDILDHMESTDLSAYEKVAVVCYTGQTAGWATSILRIMGYDNIYSMKFGMSAWHNHFAASWKTNTSNMYSTQFVTDATMKNAPGELPVLSTGKTTGQEILEARVDAVLMEGFGAAATTGQAVFANLNNYYVVNYWSEADYTGLGHVPGAVQYTPKTSLKLSADLKTLPTDEEVVVYCWTGQTSAFLTAYLRILGYNAKSLKFGANGMIYDDLTSSKFTDAAIMGYEYVTE